MSIYNTYENVDWGTWTRKGNQCWSTVDTDPINLFSFCELKHDEKTKQEQKSETARSSSPNFDKSSIIHSDKSHRTDRDENSDVSNTDRQASLSSFPEESTTTDSEDSKRQHQKILRSSPMPAHLDVTNKTSPQLLKVPSPEKQGNDSNGPSVPTNTKPSKGSQHRSPGVSDLDTTLTDDEQDTRKRRIQSARTSINNDQLQLVHFIFRILFRTAIFTATNQFSSA